MNAPAIVDPKPQLVAGARPRAIIPTNVDEVWRLANMAVKAGFAPRDFETAEKACVAMMHGLEIGLPPMMALQRIAVINGRPAVWGDAVPAIALATGLVEDWFESVAGDGDNMVATCRVKRKGIKSQAERTFSVADAKRANLWDVREKVTRRKKDGTTYEARNDSPWHRYPKRMLQMRARVAFRDLFADALGGLYIAEELDADEAAAPAIKDVTPRPVVTGGKKELPPALPTQSAQPAPAEEIEASPDDEIIEDTVGAVDEVEASKPQATRKPLPPAAKPRKDDGLDIPASLDRNGMPNSKDPEEILAWIDKKLGAFDDAGAMQTYWNDQIAPRLDALFPPDQEEASGILRKHEKRLEP